MVAVSSVFNHMIFFFFFVGVAESDEPLTIELAKEDDGSAVEVDEKTVEELVALNNASRVDRARRELELKVRISLVGSCRQTLTNRARLLPKSLMTMKMTMQRLKLPMPTWRPTRMCLAV